jgi:hypothetical protein
MRSLSHFTRAIAQLAMLPLSLKGLFFHESDRFCEGKLIAASSPHLLYVFNWNFGHWCDRRDRFSG